MKYRSKPTEIEAVRWYSGGDASLTERRARDIVAWVNANGGEAHMVGWGSDEPEIAVHTINGWAYAAPGHYMVMGSATFPVAGLNMLVTGVGPAIEVRDFYPCDPETFEQRWEPQS